MKTIVFLSAVLAMPFAARADVPEFSWGLTVPFSRFGQKPKDVNRLDLGNVTDVSLLPAGAGFMAAWNPPKLVKGNVCWLSIFGAAFANLSGLPTEGGMDVAVGLSTYNNLLGLGVGTPLFQVYATPNRPAEGMFFGYNGGARNVFVLMHLSMNIDLSSLSAAFKKTSGVQVSAPPPPNFWRLRR